MEEGVLQCSLRLAAAIACHKSLEHCAVMNCGEGLVMTRSKVQWDLSKRGVCMCLSLSLHVLLGHMHISSYVKVISSEFSI